MKVYRSLSEYKADRQGQDRSSRSLSKLWLDPYNTFQVKPENITHGSAVATIGTFDGVHYGHRKILQAVIDSARETGGESVVISFHPHPRLFLHPEDNPLRLLHTIEEKIERLEAMGIDKLLLVPFDKEFSRLTSQKFIEEILVGTVGIKKIIIGYDHRFGKNRTGSIDDLRTAEEHYGFIVQEIPAQAVDNAKVSSTKIRKALLEGDIAQANKYLGYQYPVSGTVIRGEKIGRTIGYPTANVRPFEKWKLIPGDGVYLVSLELNGEIFPGMCNIGSKPTAGDFPRGIEINLFDFDRDIYDCEVTIRFIEWIRAEMKFNSLAELVAAIDRDKARCLELLNTLENPLHN